MQVGTKEKDINSASEMEAPFLSANLPNFTWLFKLPGRIPAWWSRIAFGGLVPTESGNAGGLLGLALAFLAGLLLFTRLDQPLLDPDEGRLVEIAREMYAHHDFLVPRLWTLPYYEKPPLQYWLTVGTFSIFGLSPQAARLVPAGASWLIVIATFLWGRVHLGNRRAFLGVLMLCLSVGFIVLGRTAVLDSLLASCVVLAWFAGHTAINRPKLRWCWWLASAVCCGLGILAKGPVALVLVVFPLGFYQFLTSGASRVCWTAWASYFAVVGMVAAPWYVAMALHDPSFVEQSLWRANVVRFLKPFDHQQPFWFYLPILGGAAFPWSLLWPALFYFLGTRKAGLASQRTPGLGFCLLNTLWCLLFFSLSGCKSPPYVVPLLAPLALLTGSCLETVLFGEARRSFVLQQARDTLPRWATLGVFLVIGGCYTATALLGWQGRPEALVKLTLTLGAASAWIWWGWRARPMIAWSACAAATLVLVALAGNDLWRGYLSRHSPAALARWADFWICQRDTPVISYGRDWASASFYLQRDGVRPFDDADLEGVVAYVKNEHHALVLVETGPMLNDFLAALGGTMETKVYLPKQRGPVAVVSVNQPDRKRAAPSGDILLSVPGIHPD